MILKNRQAFLLAAKLHTEYGVMAGDIADCLMKDYDEKESVKK